MSRFVALVAVPLFVASCSLLPGPTVSIDDGVSPRMTSDQVSAVVMDQIRQLQLTGGLVAKSPRIVSLTASTEATIVSMGPPRDLPFMQDVWWMVWVEGTFNRTHPDGERSVESSGHFIIADVDGSVVSFGFP